MAVVANPLVVRIFINSDLTGHENGWAERWPIWETNWNIALAQAREMVQARSRVLSSNAYIQWGCLGTVAPPYYEQTVVIDPLEPLPQWGPAAFEMQGILFDLNNTAGENAPRLFRAVEATQVIAKRWVYADMPIPAAPPALPADLATAPKDLLWQNTLATFRQYAATQQPMSDGHHGPGDGYWVDSFSQIVYRQVGSRRWGRPWKRMSWEAAPFVNAPQFSPCGCVVTVNRISYAIPCRFGPDWQLRWIHYYEADEDATVMTFQTPFCCWNRSLEYIDFLGVGESKKFQRRNWTNGSSWGAAPGVMWTGPQSYFEGWAPEPPIPTPGFMRPACDDPVVPPGQIAQGGAGVGGLGISAPMSFTLEELGGADVGGLEDLAGLIDSAGAGAGGLADLVGLIELDGGLDVGGTSDLVGIAGDSNGGLGSGGSLDVQGGGEEPGGAGAGGLVDLVGMIDSGGTAEGGAIDGSPYVQSAQFVQVGAASSSISVSFSADVQSGNGIVVMLTCAGPTTITSVTDTLGNTYVQIGSDVTWGVNGVLSMWRALSIAAGACTVTANKSNTADYRIAVMEVQGLVSNDSDAGTNGTSGDPATGTVTVSQANDVVVAAYTAFGAVTSITPSAAFLVKEQSLGDFHGNFALAIAFGQSSSVGCTFTAPPATASWAAKGASFKTA